jgi:hypothetical protein
VPSSVLVSMFSESFDVVQRLSVVKVAGNWRKDSRELREKQGCHFPRKKNIVIVLYTRQRGVGGGLTCPSPPRPTSVKP